MRNRQLRSHWGSRRSWGTGYFELACLLKLSIRLRDREVLKVTGRMGPSAAYQFNEADLGPCGRQAASLRSLVWAGTEKHYPCPESGAAHLAPRWAARLNLLRRP